jgi:hypothetical protein
MLTKICISTFVGLLVLTYPAYPQTQSQYPSASEVTGALSRADSVLRRFESVTDTVNFRRWNAECGVVSGSRQRLERLRRTIADERVKIAALTGSAEVRASDLLDVFAALFGVTFEASALADEVARYAPDDNLSAALYEISHGDMVSVVPKFEDGLDRAVAAQESALSACRNRLAPR